MQHDFCQELKVKLLKENNLSLSTPWLKIQCKVDEKIYSYLENQAEDKFIKGTKLQEKRFWPFLKNFTSYPISTIPPREEKGLEKEIYSEKYSLDLERTYKQESLKYPKYNISEEEVKKALNYSQSLLAADVYDPLSLLSYLRISAHRIEAQQGFLSNTLAKHLKKLSDCDDKKFIQAVAVLLKENYIITKKCDWALKPASKLHPQISQDVEKFRQEEKGHDKLLLKSLYSLGITDVEKILYPEEINFMMQALHRGACQHVLAFLAILGWFEGEDYIDSDHLYKLMEKKDKSQKALRHLKEHDEINARGGHHLVAFEMGKKLPLVDKNTCLNACYLFSKYLSYYHSVHAKTTQLIRKL